MAGETKGKTYEAMVKIALDRLVAKGVLKGAVFWNERPASMTIEPDFTIGIDKDQPTHVLLVTHSGSTKNSDMKFWRNIGELVEAKVRLPKSARVYSIAFDSTIKEDLKALQAAAFDGQLLVADAPYGTSLLSWAEEAQGTLPKKGSDKVDGIRDAMAGASTLANPKRWVHQLADDIEKLVATRRFDLDELWKAERARTHGKAPTAKETFLRRGVGKLLLIDDLSLVDKSGVVSKMAPKSEVAMLKSLGLGSTSLVGVRITDPEMLWALGGLPRAQLELLHASRTNPRMAEWIETIKSLSALEPQLVFVVNNWSSLLEAKGLYAALKQCHKSPNAIAPTLIAATSRRVWLFHLLIEWIKECEGSRTSFGLGPLVEEIDQLSSDITHRDTVSELLGRAPKWQAKRSVELGLTDWHSTPSKQHFDFGDDDLARVADVLARRLARCKKPSMTDKDKLVLGVVQTVFEAKLLTYRNFKPFEVLLEAALKNAGLTGSVQPAVRSCFAEVATAAGVELDPRSSGTTVMRVKNTLINWQSASDEGRDHKKKELCGRAPALRYQWDVVESRFVRRPWAKKLFLIVDGTWRKEDLDALAQAGWDGIFYPDELKMLVAAIE
jgi:hypothetical protein